MLNQSIKMNSIESINFKILNEFKKQKKQELWTFLIIKNHSLLLKNLKNNQF